MTHTPAVDSLEQVVNLARQHADVSTDSHGRLSYDFDGHGLAAFAAALTRPPGGSERLRERLLQAAEESWARAESKCEPGEILWKAPLVDLLREAAAALASQQAVKP